MHVFFNSVDEYLAYLEQGARRWAELGQHDQAAYVRQIIARVKRERGA